MATLPLDVAGSDEAVDVIEIESADYTDYELLSPGIYTSPSRVVTAERRVDKNGKPFVMAKVEMPTIQNEEGTSIFLRKPLTKYIFSFMRKQRNRQGETSDIAKYLKAAGITLGGTVSPDQLVDALGESGQYPVKVRVGWTNRTPKLEDGSYLEERAYTGDFKNGESYSSTLTADDVASRENPKAVERLNAVLYNGKIQAKHRVDEFFRV